MERLGWSPPDGSYSCELPEAWDFEDRHRSDTPGLVLLKPVLAPDAVPERLAEPASMIRVIHYRAGNKAFKDQQEFTRRVAPGAVPKPVRVGKLPAQAFEITFFDAFPPDSTAPRQYETKSRYVVIPQGAGFWALQFTAIAERHAQYLPVFERFVESFRPAGK